MRRAYMIIGALSLACLSACALYRNDRQYIWDSEYQKVRDLYDQCGSVTVVEQVLREHRWTRAQINEVRYRLAQDYSLDERGIPRGIDRERVVARPGAPLRVRLGSGRAISQPVPPPSYY